MRAPPRAWASKLDALSRSIHGVLTADPVFALTFDDGPDRLNTPEILGVLAERGIRATFFVIVGRAIEAPELMTEMVAAGHEIALHCNEHVDLSKSSPWTLVIQIQRARRQLERLIGRPVRFFRPPHGTQSIISYCVARAAGLEVVAWSASPRDFLALDLGRQVSVALDELEPGGIVLLHDGRPPAPAWRRELTCRLLDETGRRGWKPLTVGELLEDATPDRRPWFRRRAETLIEEMAPFELGGDARTPDRAFTKV